MTKLAGKDGWIKLQEFMRFSYGTELCKVEFVDHVFSKKGAGDDAEEAKARAAEAAKKKEMSKSKVRGKIRFVGKLSQSWNQKLRHGLNLGLSLYFEVT